MVINFLIRGTMLDKLNKIRKDITPSLIPAILPTLSTFAVINASVFSGFIAAQNATIEEVVVTARKKSESLTRCTASSFSS
jgi:hypothetical protein